MKPAKFKMTELGPIPSDWEVKRLGEVAPFQRGFDLPTSQIHHGNVPVVYSNGIGNFHNRAMCMGPGLVTGRSGTIGEFTYIEEGPYWPHNTTLWVTHFSSCDPLFAFYKFKTIEFANFSTGTGVPTLNRNNIHQHLIALPPLPEQHRIAAALSDVDELIGALGKLIEKKRNIKTGTMQQLLTGKRRLPGFKGKWVEKRLGDVCLLNPSSGKSIPESFIYIDLESVANGRLIEKKTVLKSQAPSRAQRLFLKRDILFQTVRPYQKNNLYVDFDPENYVASTGYAIMRGIEVYSDTLFIYHIIHMDNFVLEVLDRCTGTSYPAINPQRLAEITIHIPMDTAEQRAIAAVLSDMDAEIAALEAERAKYARIKSGMMQELLTGKTRLKGE